MHPSHTPCPACSRSGRQRPLDAAGSGQAPPYGCNAGRAHVQPARRCRGGEHVHARKTHCQPGRGRQTWRPVWASCHARLRQVAARQEQQQQAGALRSGRAPNIQWCQPTVLCRWQLCWQRAMRRPSRLAGRQVRAGMATIRRLQLPWATFEAKTGAPCGHIPVVRHTYSVFTQSSLLLC